MLVLGTPVCPQLDNFHENVSNSPTLFTLVFIGTTSFFKKTTTLLNLQNMFRQKLLSSSVDRFCRNMFCKFKSVVVFFKILTCLLSSRLHHSDHTFIYVGILGRIHLPKYLKSAAFVFVLFKETDT